MTIFGETKTTLWVVFVFNVWYNKRIRSFLAYVIIMKMNLKKGFTLIELLVVVAIISLLTGVVLGALTTSRKKSQDSAIKTQMTSLRNQAQLYASGSGNSFNNLFTGNNTWASSDTSMQAILTSIDKQSTVHTVGSSTTAWAAQVQLKEDTTKYFCIDYTSTVKIGTVALAAGSTSCP